MVALKPSLADPYLKTTRAKIHLDALRNELDRFRKSQPCTVFHTEDVKRGRYCIRIRIDETPANIPLILGDLLYCLRSSLDQTIWALAKLSTPYPEGTQFPIFEKLNSKSRKTFANYTVGVPARAVKIIESLQPYHRAYPSAHLLWRLNRLCNIDKHRRIPVHGDEVDFHFPRMPRSLSRLIEVDHDQQMVSVPLEYKKQMTLDPECSFNVIFGDMSDGISCDLGGVTDIYNFVTNSVIPRFASFFK